MKLDKNGKELKVGDWVWQYEDTDVIPRKIQITDLLPDLKVVRAAHHLVNPKNVRKCEIEELI